MAGITSATLNDICWELKPTLLITELALSKRMAVLLGCSTSRRDVVRVKADGRPTSPPPDYFCPKAIYLGEDLPTKSVLQNFLHINASPAPGVESCRAVPLSEETKQTIQSQLLNYRLQNLPEVIKSDFFVSGLSPEANAIATVLGRCIVDAPDLQAELVSLLTPYSEQQLAASVITLKPAIRYQFKTGQRDWRKT